MMVQIAGIGLRHRTSSQRACLGMKGTQSAVPASTPARSLDQTTSLEGGPRRAKALDAEGGQLNMGSACHLPKDFGTAPAPIAASGRVRA